MYKTFKYFEPAIEAYISDEKYIILEGPGLVGCWDFDSQEFKKEVYLEDWRQCVAHVKMLFEIANNIFEISLLSLEFTGGVINEFRQKFTITCLNNIENKLLEFLELQLIAIDKLSMEISCHGNCKIQEHVKINCELFRVKIQRNNSIAISICTYNFAYLPHHPICKTRQYEIWSYNATQLAKLIEMFDNSVNLKLLTNSGDLFAFGIISFNVYYLQNKAITGVFDDTWDEFYIPFDLLEK